MKLCAVALASLVLANCYGRFPLTNSLYDWNGTVTHNRAGQSLIMWLFVLLPVYQVCMIADGVLINTIEYLSGKPVMSETGTPSDDLLTFEYVDATTALLHVALADGTTLPVSMVRVSPTRCELRDPHGNLLGSAETTPDGGLDLCDARGALVSIVTADDMAAVGTPAL